MSRSSLRRFASFALVLAACGGSPVEKYDAKATPVPYVDQYHPPGTDATYDGTENCGPAVLAGIAKGHGETGGLQDGQLVMLLAEVAGTNEIGTTGYGMMDGLAFLGLETLANRGADLDWIDNELAAGHDVIAAGDYYAIGGREQPGRHAGHYIAVMAARGDWSKYDVMDPAGRTVTSLADWELENFIESHPQGGFTLSAW
jgi:hypothetical protein